jgi:hypothetical protein
MLVPILTVLRCFHVNSYKVCQTFSTPVNYWR